SGPRSIAWACHQRLAEVAFHRWDLQRSLGSEEPLAADLAAYLLDFMLDPAGPNIMIGKAASTERVALSAAGRRWLVEAGPDGRRIVDSGAAGVEVEADPGWLALALYGRVPPSDSRLRIGGGEDGRRRFEAAFPA
ncbi:MAG: hypothetical protein JOZ39_02280, partial [Chloroflexi bacterium]|nr:hypothetical protein [Chloroflexota bacterium]